MIKQNIKSHWLLVLYLLFYFLIIANLIIFRPSPFYDWDEAIYAQVGREMISSKSLVPLWQGKYWLDKPPLTPLFYGAVGILPGNPEITTRLATLSLSIFLLLLVYGLYYRLSKNKFIALATVILTSLTTVFYQRSQVLNVDIFLLIGWYGYVLFYRKPKISFIFLAIGVLSKSLLGFYPLIGIAVFYFIESLFTSRDHSLRWIVLFYKKIKPLIIQTLIIGLWYIIMILIFKYQFIQAHFLDSHLKRVTASIEQHFGTRTFYFEMLFNQFVILIWLVIPSILFLMKNNLNNKRLSVILLGFFFLPWFLFLNLTKTKIAWYIYSVIPQFAFLIVLWPDRLFLSTRKWKNHLGGGILLIIILFFSYQQIVQNKLFSNRYSNYDDTYQISMIAKDKCQRIIVLVDKSTRESNKTLSDMDLVIGTTQWWGNHPSIVYYSARPVNFIYNINQFQRRIKNKDRKSCILINHDDVNLIPNSKYQQLSINSTYLLLK